MIISGGNLVTKRADIVYWRGNTAQLDGRALGVIGAWSSYAGIYQNSLWVRAAVQKIAQATARLPLKVYRRTADGRENGRDTPYGELIANPSKTVDPFFFWLWTQSTLNIYGEAFLGKVRDAGGRPVELKRLHPTCMYYDDNDARWSYDDGKRRIDDFPRKDFIHFRFYNPSSERGLSPLESLRSTLENEEGSLRANSAMWRNGGRPNVVLEHPGRLSDEAAARITMSWKDVHGGVDNWAKAALLEEGLKANVLPVNVEDLQYIEARKLNREEVCGAYDLPPPVLQITDNATYSNIVEQMRSMYRDTIAPKLGQLEGVLAKELRDGSMGQGEPDFPDDLYAEFLMDEVLRGDFEVRAQAYTTGINAGWLMPSEVRQLENKPFVEGSDVLLVNSTLVPVQQASKPPEPPALPPAPPQLALPPPKTLASDTVRKLMGRMSRVDSVADIDSMQFVSGIGEGVTTVLKALNEAVEYGESVEVFKHRLKTLVLPENEAPVFINHTTNVMPEVHVAAPEIHNHVAAQELPQPVVNVTVPSAPSPDVHVHTPEPRGTTRTVGRDDNGRIVTLTDTPL